MKRLALLLSFTALSSVGVNASALAPKACSEDKTSAVCKAYIEGMVQGYIASHQLLSNNKPNLREEYAARAFANRVGMNRKNPVTQPSTCLPQDFDDENLVSHLANLGDNKELTKELGNYLAKRFPCSDKRN